MPQIAESMSWTWSPFARLSVHDLYRAMRLRQEVFVLEQKCPYIDADGWDDRAWHLLGSAKTGHLVAYLRVFPPRVKYAEASIGRVVTSALARGQGLGRLLMVEGLSRAETEFGRTAFRISAQSYLQRFYEAYGFRTVSEPYLEDDIPHVEMLRDATI